VSEENLRSTAEDDEGIPPADQSPRQTAATDKTSQVEQNADNSEKRKSQDVEGSEEKGKREEITTKTTESRAVDTSASEDNRDIKKETVTIQNTSANKDNLADKVEKCKCCGGNPKALCHQKNNETDTPAETTDASTSSLKRSLLSH